MDAELADSVRGRSPPPQVDVLLTHNLSSGKELLDWCGRQHRECRFVADCATSGPAMEEFRFVSLGQPSCHCSNRLLAENERLSARPDEEWLNDRPAASKKSGDVQYKKVRR